MVSHVQRLTSVTLARDFGGPSNLHARPICSSNQYVIPKRLGYAESPQCIVISELKQFPSHPSEMLDCYKLHPTVSMGRGGSCLFVFVFFHPLALHWVRGGAVATPSPNSVSVLMTSLVAILCHISSLPHERQAIPSFPALDSFQESWGIGLEDSFPSQEEAGARGFYPVLGAGVWVSQISIPVLVSLILCI